MQHSQKVEEQLVAAVEAFAISLKPGNKVVADMSALVKATSELKLVRFDYWEGLIRSEYSEAIRNNKNPKWKFWAQSNGLLTWLDLINWDGHKREKTLKTLSGAAPNAFFFSLAIRRLNDWVPQVRKAARQKIFLLAQKTDPKYVVDVLCVLLSNWNSWGRIQDEDRKVIEKIIKIEAIAESLKLKLISSASGPMASLLSQLGRTDVLDSHLKSISETAIQPAVRAKAYRCLFEDRMVWIESRKWVWTDIRYCERKVKAFVSERRLNLNFKYLDLVKKSSMDKSSKVRRIAAEFLIKNLDKNIAGTDSLAKKFALDKSEPVSERGRFALKKLKELEENNEINSG